jgi:uncharacterized membrane protein (DUF4010 family)
MPESGSLPLSLAVALGIGLLIGAERERRKGSGPTRAPAGIRTFAIAALAGGVALAFGGVAILAVGTVVIGAFAAIAYARARAVDPGLTTEVALVTTFLLGAVAVRQPALAAGLGVVVAVLLASRTPLHRFVRKLLTEEEARDALLFAAAALVVLPLAPDEAIGPLGVFNARTLWKLVVLVMGISAAGYVALRILGARLGLPVSGLASGFISSVATIGSMGQRAVKEPSLSRAAVAGAVLSTVATVVQMVLLLLATSRATLSAMALPLLFAGIAAAAYGLVFALRNLRGKRSESAAVKGRPFDLKLAVAFAVVVTAILFAAAAVQQWLGTRGLAAAVALAGFADTHSAAISAASLAAARKISPGEAVVPILLALTTNTVTKAIAAFMAGGRRFALRVVPGLVLVILAAWAGAWVGGKV